MGSYRLIGEGSIISSDHKDDSSEDLPLNYSYYLFKNRETGKIIEVTKSFGIAFDNNSEPCFILDFITEDHKLNISDDNFVIFLNVKIENN